MPAASAVVHDVYNPCGALQAARVILHQRWAVIRAAGALVIDTDQMVLDTTQCLHVPAAQCRTTHVTCVVLQAA